MPHSLRSFLSRILASPSRRKRHLRKGIGRSSQFGVAVEFLEDRRLLTTLVVNDDGGADHTTIQAAIGAAVAGDTILVTGGADRVHTEVGINVNKVLTIQGDAGGAQVIVQADPTPGVSSRVVFSVAESIEATIDNLTIRHGRTGILNDGNLTVRNSTISQNRSRLASNSAGIENREILTILNCSVLDNGGSAPFGGIINIGTTSLEIRNSVISDNRGAGISGGLVNLTIEKSRIENNLRGIYVSFSNAEISNTIISDNSVEGISVALGTTLILTN
ncbi:MAG: right-handed parallel beta-helix repeat-containing protein, partial [Planctomycetaceae bacterium]|nr:right-handed parallel beta-helix repeat-containing protein [Planctomycetaceae bacterium]